MIGSTAVELVSAVDRKPRKVFENRFWGDCGFIHVCFDVRHMDALKLSSAEQGFPFTVDSDGSLEMGAASGRFAYIEDPDGTLVELVETFRMPILTKPRLHFDLTKRPPEKPLPNWMLKALRFSRVK